MGIAVTPDTPYYTGLGSSPDVPGLWDCALNGHTYMLDLKSNEYAHETVPLLRSQSDQGQSPSEASINPEDLWRRSQDTWHDGAGQSYLDRSDSDPARFNTSKGVDVWTKWQLSLLHGTSSVYSSTAANLALTTAGNRLFVADDFSLYCTDSVTGTPTWTLIPTATNPSRIRSVTTDGYYVYVAHQVGVFAVHSDTLSLEVANITTGSFNGLDADVVRYVKGRLMASKTNVLYNITASGAAPTALFTHPNARFTWVDFADGQTVIYAAGYSGDRSLIYKTAVKADGTALDVPTVAGELPDGEIVRAINGYLGFLLIGTDKGVRLAAQDTSGNLTIGALVPTASPVRCFEPQDRFCWYGLTNFDSTSTGLGRMDLSTFTGSVTPAYASDLMATGQGDVTSVVTFANRRVFTVAGVGVFAETTTPVSSGTLDSGQITYRLPDRKVAMYVDVKHDGLASQTVAVSVDGGEFQTVGVHTTSDDAYVVGEKRGTRFEIRLTLTASGGMSPVIRSVTLRSYPTSTTALLITAPLMLADRVTAHLSSTEGYPNPSAELAYIRDLRIAKTVATWQEGSDAYPVVVEDYQWRPHERTKDGKSWNGTCTVRFKCYLTT